MKTIDLVIIGGGSAGMSAALAAHVQGIQSICIVERSEDLGGILQQCIHNGFGLQIFKEELSGPMYAQRYIEKIKQKNIEVCLQTTVIKVTKQCEILCVNARDGYVWIQAKAIVLASGCYERNRGAIQLPGKRLAGVYTAGCAQRYLNLENIRVGKRVFILGSGDIGLIMARRMTLEGAKVVGVAEIMPYSNGLTRNVVQCLNDFDIPLYLSHTVVNVEGEHHVERITIAQVDEQKQPIQGSEKEFHVDTLLLSIGLIPENEIGLHAGIKFDSKTRGACVNEYFETSVPHIYACGNALHVHDIVDYVTMEAQEAGKYAAMDIVSNRTCEQMVPTIAGEGISYVLPQQLSCVLQKDSMLSFRVKEVMKHVDIYIKDGERIIKKIHKRCLLPAEMERILISVKEVGILKEALCVEVKHV